MPFGETTPHRPRDDIARGEFLARDIVHEAFAGLVDQRRALATHRLADQHERAPPVSRAIGWNSTNSMSTSAAPAHAASASPDRRCARVRGVQEQPSDATRRQHHAAVGNKRRRPDDSREDAAHRAVGNHQATGVDAIKHHDGGRRTHGLDEGAHIPDRSRRPWHGRYGAVYAPPPGQVASVPAWSRSKRTPERDSVSIAAGPAAVNRSTIRVAKAVASGERVVEMRAGSSPGPTAAAIPPAPRRSRPRREPRLGEHDDRHRRQRAAPSSARRCRRRRSRAPGRCFDTMPDAH